MFFWLLGPFLQFFTFYNFRIAKNKKDRTINNIVFKRNEQRNFHRQTNLKISLAY